MPQLIRYDSVTIDAVSRTPLTAIVDCSVIRIINGDTVNACTLYDASTGGGSLPLPAGADVTYRRSPNRGGHWGFGETILWAQADAGTGPIRVEYLI